MLSKFKFLRAIFASAIALLLTLGAANAESRDDLKNSAFEWLDTHGDLHPNGRSQLRQLIARDVDQDHDFCMTIGSKSTKSGEAYQIHGFAGKFHVVKLTEAQAGKLLEDPSSIKYLNGSRGYQIGRATAQINTAVFASSDAHVSTQKVSGVVSVNIKEKVTGQYAVRLTYRTGRSCCQSLVNINGSLGESLVLCSFSKFSGDKDLPVAGPLVAFVDVVCIEDYEDPAVPGVKIPRVTLVSESMPVLFNVVEPSPTPVAPPTLDFDLNGGRKPTPKFPSPFGYNLVGTKWKFQGVDTTIEFLEGGIVRWNGEVELTTKWKQEGSHVTINANDYTLFKFTLTGNKLDGTWERLKGDEVGRKYPSNLTKIEN